MTAEGNFVIANMGTRRLELMTPEGDTRILCDQINGSPLGLANFVLIDGKDRIWFTVSSRKKEFMDGFRQDVADGYIGIIDGGVTAIVADNLSFPNEIRIDASGNYLYVAETTGKRIRRCNLTDDGKLGSPKAFGPQRLGDGFPDGIAFDSLGNLWVAMVVAEKILVISPDQEIRTILDAGQSDAVQVVEEAFATGTLAREQMAAAKGLVAPLTSSIAFGGPDLQTVYLGCLAGDRLAVFHSPVPGHAMAHWR